MRVISGSAGGHHLKSPDTDKIRPTSDRVRESLFSILGPVEGAVVVDAFAGAGTLGLEALSRGAEFCYFFDPLREAITTIKENLRRTNLEARALARQTEFADGLENVIEGTPDLWFFDPPYRSSLARRGLKAMEAAKKTVTPGALVVWESARDEPIPELGDFEVTRTEEYGSTRLVFLRRKDGKNNG